MILNWRWKTPFLDLLVKWNLHKRQKMWRVWKVKVIYIYIHIHTFIYISMYLYYTQYEWGLGQWFFHQEKDALLNRNGPCSVKLQLQWHRASGQLAKLCETSQHNIASSELQSLPSRGSSARFEIWVNFIEFNHLPIVCVPFFPTNWMKMFAKISRNQLFLPQITEKPWIQIHHDMWRKNSGTANPTS